MRRVRPDAVLPPDGQLPQIRETLRQAVLLLPSLGRLITRLLRDPRVPRRAKIVLGLAVAYIASPVDLIPEMVPLLGWADDILIVMFALDSLIARAGSDVVEELWDGPVDLLELVRDVVGLSRSVMPRPLVKVFDRLTG